MKSLCSGLMLLTSVAAASSLVGCGGGSGGSTSGDPLVSGRAALTRLASGSQQTTSQSLSSALALFQQAIKANPQSTEAHFGEAVALAGVATATMDGTTTSVTPVANGTISGSSTGFSGEGTPSPTFNIPNVPSTGQIPPAPGGATAVPAAAPAHNTLGLIWFMGRSLSNPYSLLEMLGPVTDLHLGLMPYCGYATDANDVARRTKLLANLGTVLADLATVEADPTFTYTIPDPDQSGQTVTIGLPEVYLFDAYVNSLRAQIALSLSYVRDPGNWQPFAPVIGGGASSTTISMNSPLPPIFSNQPTPALLINYAALDANSDGKLEPNEYLPPSPFLTLRDATMLATAQQSIAATAAKETLGINGVLSRTGVGYLIPNTPVVTKVLNNILQNVVPLVAQAAVGPVTLSYPHYTYANVFEPLAEGVSTTGVYQYTANVVVGPNTPGTGGGTGSGSSSGSSGSSSSGTISSPVQIATVTMESVTINLTAWFNSPPPDLKAFAPTYPLNTTGGILLGPGVYPDPTFGGLFPNGLPTDLLL